MERDRRPQAGDRVPATRTSWILYLFVGVMLVVTVINLLGGEEHLLSTPAEPVSVTISARDGRLAHEGGGTYRYLVAMPDGSTARYLGDELYDVGTRVTLLRSKGRITGRVILSAPRRVDGR